ncbi:hypothetical protein BH11CYA1_BH11CYA1_07400 [soil metagenome]
MADRKAIKIAFEFLLATAACLFYASASWSLSPTDKTMILLSANGQRWGGLEGAFAKHSFSLRSSRGNAIWRDSDPNSILLVNTENESYIKVSLVNYASDFSHFDSSEKGFETDTKLCKLAGRFVGKEITIYKNQGGKKIVCLSVVTLPEIKLGPSMDSAWGYIMSSPPGSGFPVSLSSSKGHRRARQEANRTLAKLVNYHKVSIIPIEKDRFEIPKSFKLATDSGAFYFSPNGQPLKKQDIDDLFRGSVKD